MDNVVIVGDKSIEIYEHVILQKMKPLIYDFYGKCIVLNVMSSRIDKAEELVRTFRNAGLKISKIEKKPIMTNKGILKDAWEIVLEKIPILKDFTPTDDEITEEIKKYKDGTRV